MVLFRNEPLSLIHQIIEDNNRNSIGGLYNIMNIAYIIQIILLVYNLCFVNYKLTLFKQYQKNK